MDPHPLPGPLEELSRGWEDAGYDPAEDAGELGRPEWKPESPSAASGAPSDRREDGFSRTAQAGALMAILALHEPGSPHPALCPTERCGRQNGRQQVWDRWPPGLSPCSPPLSLTSLHKRLEVFSRKYCQIKYRMPSKI